MLSNASLLKARKAKKKGKDCQLVHLRSPSTEFHEVAIITEPLQYLQAGIECSDITPVALIPQTQEYLKAELILEDELSVEASHGQNHSQDILETAVYQQAEVSTAEDSETCKGSRGSYKKAFRERILCEFCPLSFTNGAYLKNHIARHAKDEERIKKGFHCQTCGKALSTKVSLVTHMKTHQTQECLKAELIMQDEASHAQNHNQDILETAGYQQAEVSTAEDSEMCMGSCGSYKKAFRERILCAFCPLSFTNGAYLRNHMARHAKDEERIKKGFHCQTCGKALSTKVSLVTHMKTHQTQECLKAKLIMQDEASHAQNHNQDILETAGYQQAEVSTAEDSEMCKDTRGSYKKAFRERILCAFCPLSFTNGAYLRNHMARHAKDEERIKKGFHCQTCGKAFSTKVSLVIHMKTYPGDTHNPQMRKKLNITLEDSVPCGVCNKIFPKAHIDMHMRVAHSKRTNKSENCARSFTKGDSLRNHEVMRHQGKIAQFPCQSCGKAFFSNGNLATHRKTHAGETHNCEVKKHKRAKHSGGTHEFSCGPVGSNNPSVHTKTELMLDEELLDNDADSVHGSRKTGVALEDVRREKAGPKTPNNASLHANTESKSDVEFLDEDLTQGSHRSVRAHEEQVADSAQGNEESATDSASEGSPSCEEHPNCPNEVFMRATNCTRSFTNMEFLRRHRVTHGKDRERDFNCQLCEMTFYTKENLTPHMKTHNGGIYNYKVSGKHCTQKLKLQDLADEKRLDTVGPQASNDASIQPKTELMSDEEFLDEENVAESLKRQTVCEHSEDKQQCSSDFTTSNEALVHSDDKHQHTTGPQTQNYNSVHPKTELMSHEEFLEDGNGADSVHGSRKTGIALEDVRRAKASTAGPQAPNYASNHPNEGPVQESHQSVRADKKQFAYSIQGNEESATESASEESVSGENYPIEVFRTHMGATNRSKTFESRSRRQAGYFVVQMNADTSLTRLHYESVSLPMKDREEVACQKCGITFLDPSRLHAHMRVHAERPYVCRVCGAAFMFNPYRTKHMLSKHPAEELRLSPDPHS